MRRASLGIIALQELGWRFWVWVFGGNGLYEVCFTLSLQDGDIGALDGSRKGIYVF